MITLSAAESTNDTGDITAHVSGLCLALRSQDAITDVVPAFNRICVHYDPLNVLSRGLDPYAWMQGMCALAYQPLPSGKTRRICIPVCYEPSCAPDLLPLAKQLGMSVDDIIALHSSAEYQVGMIGFAPGFPYLTGLHPALQAPRLANPRTRVEAGSVAIAELMCGIYPAALPGGWNIIGRTPLALFDATRSDPCVLTAGDSVCFQPISARQFETASC
jgi:KipI family sensor histidine kinase inhibitor